MSAFGGKADIPDALQRPLMTHNGHGRESSPSREIDRKASIRENRSGGSSASGSPAIVIALTLLILKDGQPRHHRLSELR